MTKLSTRARRIWSSLTIMRRQTRWLIWMWRQKIKIGKCKSWPLISNSLTLILLRAQTCCPCMRSRHRQSQRSLKMVMSPSSSEWVSRDTMEGLYYCILCRNLPFFLVMLANLPAVMGLYIPYMYLPGVRQIWFYFEKSLRLCPDHSAEGPVQERVCSSHFIDWVLQHRWQDCIRGCHWPSKSWRREALCSSHLFLGYQISLLCLFVFAYRHEQIENQLLLVPNIVSRLLFDVCIQWHMSGICLAGD